MYAHVPFFVCALQDNKTPLDLARENGYNDIVQLLEKGSHFCELLRSKVCVLDRCMCNYESLIERLL